MAKRDISLMKCDDTVEWMNFCRSSRQGCVYLWPDFLDAAGIEYELWFGLIGQELVAAVPVLMRDGKPFSSAPALLRYYGIMLGALREDMPKHRRAAWTAKVMLGLLEQLSHHYNNLMFVCSPTLDDLRGFQWFNYGASRNDLFSLELLYTGIIDLESIKDFEQYVSGIRSSRRQDARKAQSAGCTLNSSSDWKTFNEIHRLTFERQGMVEIHENDTRTMENITKAALKGGFGEMILAHTAEGETISGAVVLFDDHTAYYFAGANHPDKRNYGAGTLVLLECIERAWKRGLKNFDLCGVNSPQRGDYKTSFDASMVPYFSASWSCDNSQVRN